MHVRRLSTSLIALVAALAGEACSDPMSGPAPGGLRPERPSLGVVSGAGVFTEGLDFGAIDSVVQVFGATAPNGVPITKKVYWALTAPRPWKPTDFDVAIHQRDRSAWDTPETFRAMHGALCEPYNDAPDVSQSTDAHTHAARTYDDLNYRCRNHMMTAIKASGYGVIYLTPNATVTIPSTGEAVIRWAMSTFRTSANDWIDVWVTPWERNLALPLDAGLLGTDLQGPPPRAIHVRMTSTNRTQTGFEAYQVSGAGETKLASTTSAAYYESILAGQLQTSTRRDTFELRISSNRVKFRMWKGDVRYGEPDITEPYASVDLIDAPLAAPLDWNAGVVQFGHHSMQQSAPGVGGTWHWDDITLSPAVPFTIIRATNVAPAIVGNDRYADSKHPDMKFQGAGMPGAGERYLRFSAYGERVEVAFDGAKWIDAVRQPAQENRDGRFHSYFVRVPDNVPSTSVVSFKSKKDKAATEATNKDSGDWRVRDVAVWFR
jgi:hypothetical protein